MKDTRPLIAITMGDAAGIGPEVVVKALADPSIYEVCRPLVIGTSNVMRQAVNLFQGKMSLKDIKDVSEVTGKSDVIDILDMHNIEENQVIFGQICPVCGKSSVEYIIKAAQLALHKKIDALVTAPINKEATRLAGYGELGHLELLAHYTDTREYATMLSTGPLRTVHLTTHYSLRDALDHVTKENILKRLKLTHNSFLSWGFKNPRIGVAALNPHGGEGGILGREEIEHIAPAVKAAVEMGIDARGPYPADSIFNRAIKGEFDAVLAMYHDQGHIPIKVYGFEKSISVALGLPFIRTSVDHGTAFDIAGKGIAEAESMKEAIRTAVSLVQHRFLQASRF
jgi:4-hydroxythreonine-4-phosphate dehydrogenase